MFGYGTFQVTKQGDDAAITASVCERTGHPIPYLTLVLAPERAHEMARQLIDVVGPDPVIEQRIAIEVHEKVKAQSAELIHAAHIATLAMARRALANHDGGAFTGPGMRAALQVLDDVIEAETAEDQAGER